MYDRSPLTHPRLLILSTLLLVGCADDPEEADGGEDDTSSSDASTETGSDSTETGMTEAEVTETGDGDGDTGDGDTGDGDTGDGDTGDGDTGDGDGGPVPDCDNLTPLPLEYTIIEGARRSEDYVFDALGNLVSLRNQSLFHAEYNQDYQFIFPGVSSGSTAGTAMLPNGDVVFNDVDDGEVTRLTPNGETSTLVGGLPYPNGITVDDNGWVWVALDNGESVIRFDPDNPVTEVVFETDGPNGLAFSADYRRLYVGSYDFGGLKMWNLDTEELTVIDDTLGGVDGVLVDVCDNVYVTQYDVGRVWRIAPDLTLELVAELPSWWIPNLNFGSGVGGWKHDHIYISDLTENRVFEFDPGTWGIDQPQL